MINSQDIESKLLELKLELKAAQRKINVHNLRVFPLLALSSLLIIGAYVSLIALLIDINTPAILTLVVGYFGLIVTGVFAFNPKSLLESLFKTNLGNVDREKEAAKRLRFEIWQIQRDIDLIKQAEKILRKWSDKLSDEDKKGLLPLKTAMSTASDYPRDMLRIKESVNNYELAKILAQSKKPLVFPTTAPAGDSTSSAIPAKSATTDYKTPQSTTPKQIPKPSPTTTGKRPKDASPIAPSISKPATTTPSNRTTPSASPVPLPTKTVLQQAGDLFSEKPKTRKWKLPGLVASKPDRKRNYLEQYLANQDVGLAGEEFVLEFERNALMQFNRPDLAARVMHVSKDRGDDEGFDILSFDKNGEEKLIEVKSTGAGYESPFYLTENELAKLKASVHYFIYRVYQFDPEKKSGKIYIISSASDLNAYFSLEPCSYRVHPNDRLPS